MIDGYLEKLIEAADNHGEDSGEPDHTIGDLQDMLREAWGLLSFSQKLQLIQGDAVENVVECGGRDELSVDAIVAEVGAEIAEMHLALTAAGYEIKEGEWGFFWETKELQSEDFADFNDAVLSAYDALTGKD